MSFFREVFSEDGQGSASRVMMLLHALAGIGWLTHVVVHTHQIPDATTITGITGFISAPYAINKFGSAVDSISGARKTP